MMIVNQNFEEVEISELVDWIDINEEIAFDLETTGLNTRKDSVMGIGLSNADTGYYVVHQNYEKLNMPGVREDKMLISKTSKEDCIFILKKLIGKKLDTWNGSFDCRFTLDYFGIDLTSFIYIEGQLAKHTVQEEDLYYYRLKPTLKELYGEDETKEQEELKESVKANGGSPKSDFYMADLRILALYCIKDCTGTFNACNHYKQLIEEAGQHDFFFNDEVMPLYREVTIPMEHRGVSVDVEALKKSQTDIARDIDRIEDEIQIEINNNLEIFTDWFLNKDYPAKRTGPFAQAIIAMNNYNLPKNLRGFSLSQKNLESMPEGIWKDYLCPEIYTDEKGNKVKTFRRELLDNEDIRKVQEFLWKNETEKKSRYMFNLGSSYHIKKLFFDTLHEDPIAKTPTGAPKADDAFLDNMAEKYSWAAKLRTWRKLTKLKGTYIDRFLNSQEDGVFYPKWQQWGTISGRYSGDLQQLNRPKEEGELEPIVLKYNNMIRQFFIAKDGYKFLDADYESLEPHVFADVSGDEGIKNIFRKGHDFYSTIAIGAERLTSYSADKKANNYLGLLDKPLRQKAKAYSLGVPYGMESYALGMTLKIHQEEAQEIIDGYMEAYPELHKWMENTKNLVVTKGEVRSKAGRIRHMPMAPKIWYAHGEEILNPLRLWQKYNDNPQKYKQMKFLRKKMKNFLDNGKNWQIQSLSASIVNRAAIKIAKYLKENRLDGYIVANIHDQIIVHIKEEYAEKFRPIMENIMKNAYKISIPLNAPACIAKDFYEGH